MAAEIATIPSNASPAPADAQQVASLDAAGVEFQGGVDPDRNIVGCDKSVFARAVVRQAHGTARFTPQGHLTPRRGNQGKRYREIYLASHPAGITGGRGTAKFISLYTPQERLYPSGVAGEITDIAYTAYLQSTA